MFSEVHMDHQPLPGLLKGGLLLFVVAAAADLGYHLLPRSISYPLDPLWGPSAVNAHVLLVMAMGVLLLGVVQHGVRLRPRAEPSPLVYRVHAHTYTHRNVRSKEMRDAHR
jgi:hypothetical protein